MFETWKEFKETFNKEKDPENPCKSCDSEDFDLLTTEKEADGDIVAAFFICKNCGIQKKVEYRELEKN